MQILVAGVGNVLQGDDGFGVEVARRLAADSLPDGVKVVETGIGGVHLVQEILAGFDALVVVDAVDYGRAPGTVLVIEPTVEDIEDMPFMERMDHLADMHYTKPAKALMLAKALKVLPARSYVVGCQPAELERFGRGLSPEVERAVPVAIAEIKALVGRLLASGGGDGG
jgi:hydrogenase maturation protease